MRSAEELCVFPVERRLALEVLDEAVQAPSVPLMEALLPPVPGAYLLHFTPRRELRVGAERVTGGPMSYLYSGLGGYPLYVGSTTDLRDRAGRHRKTLARTSNLSPFDFSVTALPMASIGLASFSEHELTAALRPGWNLQAGGFGSKHLGAHRRTQAVSPWATLHPREGAGTGAGAFTALEVAARLAAHFRQFVRPGFAWPL